MALIEQGEKQCGKSSGSVSPYPCYMVFMCADVLLAPLSQKENEGLLTTHSLHNGWRRNYSACLLHLLGFVLLVFFLGFCLTPYLLIACYADLIFIVEVCVAEWLTRQTPDLEVPGSSTPHRVVSIDKEIHSTLSPLG